MFIDINTLIQSQGEMVTRIEDYVNSKLDEASIKLLITSEFAVLCTANINCVFSDLLRLL